MAEHLIRLRGGWHWDNLPDGLPPRRVSLPVTWPADASPRVRLIRQFGRPPIDGARETLRLRMVAVPGLVAVWLNGREIARPQPGTTSFEVALEHPLTERNELVLEVEPGPPVGAEVASWGEIALVIAPIED